MFSKFIDYVLAVGILLVFLIVYMYESPEKYDSRVKTEQIEAIIEERAQSEMQLGTMGFELRQNMQDCIAFVDTSENFVGIRIDGYNDFERHIHFETLLNGIAVFGTVYSFDNIVAMITLESKEMSGSETLLPLYYSKYGEPSVDTQDAEHHILEWIFKNSSILVTMPKVTSNEKGDYIVSDFVLSYRDNVLVDSLEKARDEWRKELHIMDLQSVDPVHGCDSLDHILEDI